jgi:hypothetical protein
MGWPTVAGLISLSWEKASQESKTREIKAIEKDVTSTFFFIDSSFTRQIFHFFRFIFNFFPSIQKWRLS